MPLFRLMIEGRDFPGFLFDKPDTAYGFFTTRWIEAQDEEAAELAAVESVRWEYRELRWPISQQQKAGDPDPMLYLVEIEEVSDIPEDAPNSGATWYPMDAE